MTYGRKSFERYYPTPPPQAYDAKKKKRLLHQAADSAIGNYMHSTKCIQSKLGLRRQIGPTNLAKRFDRVMHQLAATNNEAMWSKCGAIRKI